ncbi:MAG: phasin family protein [Pseudomonadota bacterium]
MPAKTDPAKTDAAKAATDMIKDASERVESFAADTQKAMGAQMEKLSKGFESAATFGHENMDAVMKSSEIATKAMEGLNAEIADFTKKSFEDGVAATKDFASAKSVAELMEKQADFAKTSMDGFMKQAAKVNEMYMSATRSAVEPLSARVTAATDMLKGMTA